MEPAMTKGKRKVSKRRVVIIDIGVISPNGIGKKNALLKKGISGKLDKILRNSLR